MKLPRSYYAVSFILLLLAPLLFKAGFIFYFTVNKAEIVNQYCVNKKAPEKKCNGKCHLKKIIKTETFIETDSPSDSQNFPYQPNFNQLKESHLLFRVFHIFFDNNYASEFLSFQFSSVKYQSFNQLMGRVYSPTIFHPPTV